MRAVRARVTEDELVEKDKSTLMKQISTMSSLMVEKDSMISALKTRLGKLRKVLRFPNSGKPPSSKSGHFRSQSELVDNLYMEDELSDVVTESMESTSNLELLTYQEVAELKAVARLLDRAAALECSQCGRVLPKTQFGAHIEGCSEDCADATADTEGDLQVKEYRNLITQQRAELKVLRTEVKTLSDQLRQVKVEIAVQAERAAEREHELKAQQKALVSHILTKDPGQLSELASLLQPVRMHSRSPSLQSAP
jgi:DNA repair exonuclease SbcCD ATPase subunit